MNAEFPPELTAPSHVLVVPAHPSNYGGYGASNEPRALVLHTPEEDADDNEVTPRWFQNPDAHASTHYYADSDGDLYQMVPDKEGAYAQGVKTSQRTWKGQPGKYPPWAVGVSNNLRALSIEIEGRAKTFKWGPRQRQTVVAWIAYKANQYKIPLDRTHIVGHEELASHKRDPGIAYGTFDIDQLVADARAFNLEATPPPIGQWELVAKAVQGKTTTVPVGYRGDTAIYELLVRR